MRPRTTTRHSPSYLLIFLCLWAGTTSCGSNQPSSVEATTQANRAISLATQVAANLHATREVESAKAQATFQAMEGLLLQVENWPVAIEERFDQNELQWPTGEGDDPLATIQWEIRDSQYHWHAVANEPFVWWTIPDTDNFANFFLAVELQQIDGPATGEAGLVFRLSDNNYYLFEINASQQYSFFLHNQDGWEAIKDWSDSASISMDGPNRLGLIAHEDNFHLFINNLYLTTLVDDQLEIGSVGVLTGLSNAGDEGSWVFDNFVLQTPPIAEP